MPLARTRICLMLERFDFGETYLDIVWKSLHDEAASLGLQLVILSGEALGSESEGSDGTLAAIFRLPRPEQFGGYVLVGSAFNMLPPASIAHLRQELPPIPGITTTHKVEGLASVTVDNTAGLRDLVRHLIHHHKYRRIACIMGPQGNHEAEERKGVWAAETSAAGLVECRNLLVQGHFTRSKAPGVLDRLLALPGGPPEAVVVCNDELAIDICEGLAARGMVVPRDMAVVGFDNIARGLYLPSPLSTVDQSIETMARTALRKLAGIMAGSYPEDASHVLASTPVIRSSCGCKARHHSGHGTPVPFPMLDGPDLASERILSSGNLSHEDVPVLREAIAHTHRKYWDVLGLMNVFNDFVRETSVIADTGELSALIGLWLPRLGIKAWSMVVVVGEEGKLESHVSRRQEGDAIAQPPSRFKVLSAFPLPSGVREGQTIIGANDLVAPGWFDLIAPRTVVGMPLSLGRRWYGIIFMDIGTHDSIVFQSIQNHLATVLDREIRLSRMVEQAVREQARVQSEQAKLQAMATFVRGISHEINTPLGIGITATSYLGSRLTALHKSYDSEGLTRTELGSFLGDAAESVTLAQGNMEKAAALVQHLKTLATRDESEPAVLFDLAVLIRNLVTAFKIRHTATEIQVETHLPDSLEVRSHPGSVSTLVSELLDNAVHHGTVCSDILSIGITLVPHPDKEAWCRLILWDDGCGFEEENLDQVFEPFFTTRRASGHRGLGLNLVWNIATGILGGTLGCGNREPRGAEFTVEFPCRQDPGTRT